MNRISYLLSVLLFAAISFSACRKQHNISANGVPADASYFIFGRGGGFCGIACAQFYKMADNKLYKGYYDASYQLQYSGSPLPDSKFILALPLSNGFPEYLKSRPNQDIGCTTCPDAGNIYLEYKQGSTVYYWNIGPAQDAPAELNMYLEQLGNILNGLQ